MIIGDNILKAFEVITSRLVFSRQWQKRQTIVLSSILGRQE